MSQQQGWTGYPNGNSNQNGGRPPRNRHLALKIFGGVCGVFVLIAVVGAITGPKSPASSSTPPGAVATLQTVATVPVQTAAAAPARTTAAAPQVLTYKVTGSPADVTYGPTGTNVAGSVPLDVSGPLGTPLYYSITAQLQGSGAVTCELLIDGKVISQASASGGYNLAQCEISRDPLSGQWTNTNG